MPAIPARFFLLAWLNFWHDQLWLFEVSLTIKGIFLTNPFIFIIPKTIVFYRWCVLCILHVSLPAVLSTLNISCARFLFWLVLQSHTEQFFFFVKKHEPRRWSNSLEKRTGNSSCLLSFLTSISFISWLLQISGICIINRGLYFYVRISAAY